MLNTLSNYETVMSEDDKHENFKVVCKYIQWIFVLTNRGTELILLRTGK